MANLSVKKIGAGLVDKSWARIIGDCNGATIFHTPEFLSYHKERFSELHLGVYKGEQLIGLMPMAIREEDYENAKRICAVSPYGASYGSFVFLKQPGYSEAAQIADSLIELIEKEGVEQLRLTPPLISYYEKPCSTFIFALLERGFRAVNADISSVIPLCGDLESETFSSRARNMARKARAQGVVVERNASLDEYWPLMEKTFNRHGVSATHTREEFDFLMKVLPDWVFVDIARLEGKPVAGIGYFRINSKAIMSYYLCSDPEFRDSQALSMLVYDSILRAQEEGYQVFDFGTSSVGMVASENIFRFKESYGAVGEFRHTFAWDKNRK